MQARIHMHTASEGGLSHLVGPGLMANAAAPPVLSSPAPLVQPRAPRSGTHVLHARRALVAPQRGLLSVLTLDVASGLKL